METAVIYADKGIAERLEREFSAAFEVKLARSYEDCLAVTAASRAAVLILQAKSPVAGAQDLMCDLQLARIFPAVLFFEERPERELQYTATGPFTHLRSVEVESLFYRALGAGYTCTKRYFRTTAWKNSEGFYGGRTGFDEALKELLRGCTREEYAIYKKEYGLDLRDRGFYLYFWDFQYIEYMEHRSYKDIYNHIGSIMIRECRQAISQYNGGEGFYIDLLRLCIIINDLPLASEANKSARFEAMLQALARATGCKKAIRYLSKRVPDTDGLRDAYDAYAKEKGDAFFVRNKKIIRSSQLERLRRETELPVVQGVLDEITRLLRYDIRNPKLQKSLRRLYLEVLKPAMSYSLYYFSVAVLCAELVRLMDESVDRELLHVNLSPGMIQFSSIEEQYDTVSALIFRLQEQAGKKYKSKKSLILKAMDYMEENYGQEITVSDIAGALYISNVYLNQIFKSELNTSVIKHLITLRIEKAKELRADTDELIYCVAEKTGFHDARHFSKTFKRMVGQTPLEYRRGAQKNIVLDT